MSYRDRFFDALEDVFVGAKVEGDSGYINLMAIKAHYYRQNVFPQLARDIVEATEPFPAFREEMFQKLYTFFSRYFSDSGSIYFAYTPLHQRVYEQVYTDDRDVILFYKTHMLYYVKTDRLFRDLDVELDGVRFHFDVSNLEHKRANEKRRLIYDVQSIEGNEVSFGVTYSERGRKTKINDILRALNRKRLRVDEELLQRAFGLFERQSEVDYFINQDAKAFLEEQFDLWLYQYVFCGESAWTKSRLQQLQVLKTIAYRIIAFIAQFEDELVRVWNKPKFVRQAHYVITLERIARQPGGDQWLARLLAHPGLEAQRKEWIELGMVQDDFDPARLGLAGGQPAEAYRFLPLDTRHFPDLELPLVRLFDNLDEELDGWLVHSENYQALNTLLPKFRRRIKCIYIDPPYNSPSSEIMYQNQFKHSSWLSLMANRLGLARDLLAPDGVLVIAIDDIELCNLRLLTQALFPDRDLTTVTVVHNPRGNITNNFSQTHEYALFLTPEGESVIERTVRDNKAPRRLRRWGGYSKRLDRPTMFYPIYVKDKSIVRIGDVPDDDFHPEAKNVPLANGEIEIWPIDRNGIERRWNFSLDTIRDHLDRIVVMKDGDDLDLFVSAELTVPKTVWAEPKFDAGVYGSNLINQMLDSDFTFPKSIHTVQQSIELVCRETPDAVVLDFFAGSGTTAHAVIDLNRKDGGRRKYVLVEMADYFDTVLLPRVKKAVFCENWKDGRPVQPVQSSTKGSKAEGAPAGQGLSHFVKYYQLEQYEDTLRRARYRDDADLFHDIYQAPYHRYVFMRDPKMLEALDVDVKANAIEVHLERLYPDIDVPETLSNLTGQWLKRIHPDPDDATRAAKVEFADGETIDLKNLNYRLVKPLIWW